MVQRPSHPPGGRLHRSWLGKVMRVCQRSATAVERPPTVNTLTEVGRLTQLIPGQASHVPFEFRPLHKYLRARFADSLVLTFDQIVDLIGQPLPAVAYTESAWWASSEEVDAASPQSTAWICADRTALANLLTRTVLFDRRPDR
jgi:hypothetical protein